MSVGGELVARLAGAGLGLVAGTNLFSLQPPDTLDTCVWLIEYSGAKPEHDLGTEQTRYEWPRVQLYSRAPLSDDARAAARSCYAELVKVANVELSGTRYLGIEALDQPWFMGREGPNDLAVWTCRFELLKEPS